MVLDVHPPEAQPPKHSLIYTLPGLIQNPQKKCVFFITMPPEIRSIIFALALSSYDDKLRPYPDDAYHSRPGYRFHQIISTSLLSTCRRIYRETHDLPVSLNEHVFYVSAQRGPKRRFSDDPISYFGRFTEEQKKAAARGQLHLFTQLFWLQSADFVKVCKTPYIRPKYMRITIRHSDWWFWETNIPLAMNDGWINSLKFLHGLETFEVELETMERDKNQVEAIAKSMFKWKPSLANSRVLTIDVDNLKRERYLGQSRFASANGSWIQYFPDHRNTWRRVHNIRSDETLIPLPFVVITLRWTVKDSE